MKRSTIILSAMAALLLFAFAVTLGIRSAQSAQAQKGIPTSLPVTTLVTRGDVTQTVLAPGQLVNTREVVLSAAEAGRLEEMRVLPGSIVRQGEAQRKGSVYGNARAGGHG